MPGCWKWWVHPPVLHPLPPSQEAKKKKNGLIRIELRLLFCKDVQRNININRSVSRATIRPSASSQVQQAVSTCYFKLPYVGSFTREAQIRLRKLVQRYCTNIEIKLAFSSFKVGSMFSLKDPVAIDLRSRVFYKFLCAGCMPVTSARLADTSRRAFVSIWAGIGIHTFISICSNPRHVVV